MNPQQTGKNYDQLDSYWNGDKFHRANGVAQHQRAFRFASKKEYAIDIGSGSSGRLIELLTPVTPSVGVSV